MKVEGVPGEFAFRALVHWINCKGPRYEWHLTENFYVSMEEVKNRWPGYQVKWPVELREDGVVYIPAPEELT